MVVCPSVKTVVPPLDVVVRSNGQHVDKLAGRRPHCASSQRVLVVAPLRNMDGISASGRKSRAVSFRICGFRFVCGAVCAVS